MSRRSPANERYQKFTSPKGQTRKSAAQAKPTRKEGSASASSSAKAKAKPKGAGAKSTFYEPDTPEYKRWRRLWWWALGVGFIFVAISFAVQYLSPLKGQPWSRPVGFVILGLAYASIIAAFLIDWRKMRPLRALGPGGKPAEKPAAKSHDNPAKSSAKSAEKSDDPFEARDTGDPK